MPRVFVHGNPETSTVWGPLLAALAERGIDDMVLLSPPGFGTPVPDGFGCTAPEYRDWLVGELGAMTQPVDLVGHDWGAGHLFAVAADRPDLLRTWAADCSGIIHPDYAWHPAAATWQTEVEGEALIAQMVTMSGDDFIASDALPAGLALSIAEHFDDEMGRAILAVYRSARQPYMRELGERLAAAQRVPSLIVHATADRYTNPELTAEVAERLGSQVLTLPGCGHWWMWEEPDRAADALVGLWSQEQVAG